MEKHHNPFLKFFLFFGFFVGFRFLGEWLKGYWLHEMANPDLVLVAIYGIPLIALVVAWRQGRYTQSSLWRELALVLVVVVALSAGLAFGQGNVLLQIVIGTGVIVGVYFVTGKAFFASIWDESKHPGESQPVSG